MKRFAILTMLLALLTGFLAPQAAAHGDETRPQTDCVLALHLAPCPARLPTIIMPTACNEQHCAPADLPLLQMPQEAHHTPRQVMEIALAGPMLDGLEPKRLDRPPKSAER